MYKWNGYNVIVEEQVLIICGEISGTFQVRGVLRG